MSEQLFIVDGLDIINSEIRGHNLSLQLWVDQCHAIEDSFFTKTSRVATNKDKTNVKEYTYRYRTKSDFGIESCGKEKPDIESYFPPKPVHPIQFEYQDINGRHILISSDDLENNLDLFIESYIFRFKGLLPLSGGDINV